MLEIDKYMHKPFFDREPDCKPGPGHVPHKPRYTMTEEVEHTTRLMRETIERLLKFEERAKAELGDLSRQLTSDNVIFKNAMHESWTTFLMEVKNEINVFESNIEADIRLFKTEIETDYATLSEDVRKQVADNLETFVAKVEAFEAKYESEFTALSESLQEQYNSFVEACNARMTEHNEAMAQAFADYQRQLNTYLNTFEQTMNTNYATFTESIGNSMHEFKEFIETTLTERLTAQDRKLSDAELYMKTNLEANIATLIGDMHANGELADIIEGEVFNDLETTIRSFDALSVKYFGATGNGTMNDTAAFEFALSVYGTQYKALTIPEGVYLVDKVEFPENIVVFANNATLKRSAHDGTAFVTFNKGATVYGNLTIDGDKENANTENENGVVFLEGCRSYGVITSHNNSKHGVSVGSKNAHNSLVAFDNGKTGTATGDGNADGVYVLNSHDVIIRRIEAYNNKRMGLTVTTFNEVTSAPDVDLMGRVQISNVYAHNNTYKDVDVEFAKQTVLENVETVSSLTASHSEFCVFRNCRTGGFYSNGGNDNVVEDFVISPVGSCNDVVYIDGDGNRIRNVRVKDTATAYTSNTVSIIGANDIDNVHVENGNNAFICEDSTSCRNVRVDKANNRLRTVNGVTVPTNDFALENGRIVAHFNAPFEKGNIGDVIYNNAPVVEGGTITDKWICTAANTWTPCMVSTTA